MAEEAEFAHFCLLRVPTIQVVSSRYHRCAKQWVPAGKVRLGTEVSTALLGSGFWNLGRVEEKGKFLVGQCLYLYFFTDVWMVFTKASEFH